MAKAKSKRQKNADFQKVKLKVGKKLSKGDNVTNLSFKTRQIQLTQTIRTGDTALPVTRRNLSIQDLLRQCDHHSVGARVNAVAGIKELLLNNFKGFLIPSNVYGYGAVMKKISSMLIDNESDVRHFVINLFKLMFTKLKAESQKMSADNLMSGSLFSHIHAYLCCAMNHLHEDIRLDSLILFDSLLEAFPHAMVQQTGDLLKNLISMISSPISIGAKADSVTQRLSMNPDSKLPVMKFRARVLLRLKLTLQVALLEVTNVDEKPESTKNTNGGVWSLFCDKSCDGARQNTLLVSKERVNKFSLILKGAVSDIQDYIIKPSSLEEFIKLSIPVLLQCWKEARASGQNEIETGDLISADALEVMSLVVSVIELLFSLSATSCGRDDGSPSQVIPTAFLVENYEAYFTQDFMNHFPYSAQIEVKVSKKRKPKGQPPTDHAPAKSSLTSLNLCVCHIMSYLCRKRSDPKQRPWISKIQQFVVKTYKTSPSSEHNKLLTKILLNIFHNPSLLGHFVFAFEAACKYYITSKVKQTQKRELFNLFAFVFKQWDGWKSSSDICCGRYSHCEKMEGMISKFLKSLPKLLLRIPKTNYGDLEWVKETLSCISSSLNGQGLLSVYEEIRGCLTDILGLLSVDDEDVQQKVLSLLSLGPVLNKDQLKQILLAVRRPATKPTLPHRKSRSLACQAITCASLGIRKNIPLSSQVEFNEMTQAQRDCLSDYLKFMFSLLIGMSREELETVFPSDDTAIHEYKNIDYNVEKDQWERHKDIAVTVCQEMVNLQIPASPSDGFDQTFTFTSNMEQLWKHTLTKYKNVHIMSAYSLFKFIYYISLNHFCEKPSSEFYEMTAEIIACVLTSFYSPNAKGDKVTKEIIEGMKAESIASLCCVAPLLPLVCNILQKTGSTGSNSEEKLMALKAMEFLRSDDRLKTRISTEELLDSTEQEEMDLS